MATCKDCIHYEICARQSRMVQIDEHTWDEYEQLDDVEKFCECFKNTADVAPRAEVVQIFEEIEKTLNRKIRRSTPEYERLDECFEKLSDCGHSNHGYFKGIISTCEDLQDIIDELKKKYTEGEK